jgi:tetratricopeptide (TPR) repeat protein
MAKESSNHSTEQVLKNKLKAITLSRHFMPANKKLLELYLETIPDVLPNTEVVKIIQDMVNEDHSNIFLWKHYFNNACSISSTAEEVKKEYEKAINLMRKMNDCDIQMMQLFKMYAQFIRQAGLMEQFFAIINLMMSINVNADVEGIFYTSRESQNSHLVEYEELCLSSNLPMPELWFRIETLRSICNFLPVLATETKMEDPQRFVFNEDICSLVNPLKNQRAYSFDLFLVILKLLKFPFPHYKIFHDNEILSTDNCDLECGQSFLSILFQNLPPSTSNDFNKIFYNVIKDISVSPSFLAFNIEFEPYLECIMKLLEICNNSFNDRQNKIVLILWLRLQRLSIQVDQLKSLAEQKENIELAKYKKQIKSRVKNILKASKYQNDSRIYREYALIELALNDEKSAFKILEMAMEAGRTECEENFYQILIEFCEQKLSRKDHGSALQQLRKISDDNLLEFLSSKLTELKEDDCEEIEDYFLPNTMKLEVIKAKVFILMITKSKKAALTEIISQINLSKQEHLREKLYEFYVWTFHLKITAHYELPNHRQYMQVLTNSLKEFPRNIFIMHVIAYNCNYFRWFDIRKTLLKTPTNESLFYLLISSKFLESKFTEEDESKIYKHRIFNTIDSLLARRTSGISSILTWRLYLRAAFNYDFSKCRRILYQALDKYPLVKSFYLDGSRYLSEDLSQLHDLMVENGMRIHSLIEELEILRSST